MKIQYTSLGTTRPTSLLQKVVSLFVLLVFLSLALMFTAVLLPVIVVLVLIGGTYMWWKTREVRRQFKQMQAQMQQMGGVPPGSAYTQRGSFRADGFEGEIVEGEVVREHRADGRDRIQN